jgi:alpha-L-arabinofuranosidase
MDRALQFSKTQSNLIEKINQIVNDVNNPREVRNSFAEWLDWFKSLKNVKLKDLQESNPFHYRAFTIPDEKFFAVQIWEKHPTENLIRCSRTLFANKVSVKYWADKVEDNRKIA